MRQSEYLLGQIGVEFISSIKNCIGENTGTHAHLQSNTKCAGCGATSEILSLIRVREKCIEVKA